MAHEYILINITYVNNILVGAWTPVQVNLTTWLGIFSKYLERERKKIKSIKEFINNKMTHASADRWILEFRYKTQDWPYLQCSLVPSRFVYTLQHFAVYTYPQRAGEDGVVCCNGVLLRDEGFLAGCHVSSKVGGSLPGQWMRGHNEEREEKSSKKGKSKQLYGKLCGSRKPHPLLIMQLSWSRDLSSLTLSRDQCLTPPLFN